MNTRELRIGNIVRDDLGWIRVTSIKKDMDDKSIYHVKLNEEWLLKLGFIKEDFHDFGSFLHLDISDTIGLNMNKNTIWLGQYDTGIQYVHQLQNLYFALTGKELSLKDENTF